MKRFQILLTLLFFAGMVVAEDPAGPQLTQMPPGTSLAGELSKSIDAHKAKTGDPVVVKTTQDMLAEGKVIIPHDSKIIGHITEVQGRPKGQKGDANSTIGIAFDQLEIKGGRTVPLQATIQAIAKPLLPPTAATGVPNEPAGGYGGGTMSGGSYPGRNSGAAPPTPTAGPGAENTPESGYPGAISVQSQGVVGMKGISLAANDQGSVISSTTENVKLDSGTQIILKTK